MGTVEITYRSVRSAVITVDNRGGDAECPYNIIADLHFKDGQITSIGGGRVSDTDGDRQLATFGENSDGSLWLNFDRPGNSSGAVLAAIEAFNSAARKKAGEAPPAIV